LSDPQNSKTGNDAELLRSLGKLARGLSALFWGLPAALIVCAETARIELLKPIGIVPALVANALLLFGLWQMGDFQKQERPWRNALDRAKLLGLVNLGLSPFLFFENKMPEQPFFRAAVFVLVLSALFFLFNLNSSSNSSARCCRTKRCGRKRGSSPLLNRWLLVGWMVFVTASIAVPQLLICRRG
jgi:hypothetical protein